MQMKLLKLSPSQTSRLSDVCLEIGTIGLASVALPAVLDSFKIFPAIAGITSSLFFWFISINLAKKYE
jgi:hypothetical protein